MSLTPFMSMSLPVVGVTPGGGSGTAWGPLLTGALGVVDAHDHSPGKGAPLTFTSGSFQVATDLGFGGHSLYSIKNILASGTVTATALSGSLTQIPFMVSGTVTGTLAAFVGVGGIQVATNSLGQVLISASIGDDKYASYVLAVPDAENPNFRQITGSGGTAAIDSGPGNFLTLSSSIGADKFAAYLTALPTAGDPNARVITGSGNASIIDGGAGSTLTVSGSVGADRYAAYLTTISSINDPNARTLSLSGSGLGPVDGGPGGVFRLASFDPWNDTGHGIYATSSVTVVGPGGFTGSLTQTGTPGYPFLVGIGGVNVTTNSLGQVIVSGSVPTISDLTGAGATAVSAAGSIWTVSSSIPTATQVQFVPLTASNWNPSPTTVGQALVQLAQPNFTASLVPPQSGQAVVSVSGSIAKAKSGVVNLNGTLVVNPTLTASGTAQLFRDAIAIGPTLNLLMNTQVPQAFAINWIDTLPDVAIHTYSMQVSASVGTLTVLSGSGALTVREIN